VPEASDTFSRQLFKLSVERFSCKCLVFAKNKFFCHYSHNSVDASLSRALTKTLYFRNGDLYIVERDLDRSEIMPGASPKISKRSYMDIIRTWTMIS
jgi:hypothetical protein